MKKFFSLVLMTLILGLSAFAQSDYAYTAEITIGDPSSTITSSSIPVNDYYKYSASRSLYFPGELQVTGDITDISYYFAYSSATRSMALSIYMGIVDRTSFSGAADFVPMDSLTLVWSGNKSFQPNSWNTITLDTPFSYDGTGSLVIAVLNTTGAYDGSGRIFKMTPAASATRATAHYQDATSAPANVATAFGSSATSTSSPILKVTFGSDQPFCAAPSFDISEVTSSSFDITITDEDASSYLVRYKSDADEDWMEMPLNDITATISDLTSNTLYTVGIAKLCDNGEYTPYATQTVRTACGTMNVPYEEGFESYATAAIPTCYDAHYGVSGYPQVYSGSAHGGSKCINFHSVADPNTSSTLILPQFEEDINTLRVKYWTRREGASSGRLEIGVISDPTDLSTFIVVDSVSAENTDNNYAGYITSFDGLEVDDPSAYRIAFRYVASRSTAWYWYLDDVAVEEIPDCAEPTSLAVADIQTNSAELSWAGSEDISYTVYYKPTNSQEAYEEISGVNSPYLLEDLEANTAYTWYVAAECADEPVASLSTSQFRTACALIEELPVVFDMEEVGGESNPVPVCWIRGNGSTTYPYSYSYSTYAISGSRSLYFYYKNTIALPAINLDVHPINTLQVTLKTRYSSQYNFSVGVMTDPTDTTTFEPVSTFAFGGSVDSVTVSLAGYEGEGTYIAFRNEPTGTDTYTSAYVDDVVVEEIPDCGPVNGLAVENATAESVTLSWIDEDKEYDVYMRVSEEDEYELVASSATTPAEISSLE
ncbi:MAG: fibronectin type III domain-containing protein, partial [Bacteroidales bacterium]|nr:fibronectin type III domain-containing protein [Bacteroidales bacterium]